MALAVRLGGHSRPRRPLVVPGIIWHPESLNGLNPETGELYWSQPFAVKANLTIPSPGRLVVWSHPAFANQSM
jgi:hypothetical protein